MTIGNWSVDSLLRPAGPCGEPSGPQITTSKSWNGNNYVEGESPGTPHPYSMLYVYNDRGYVRYKPTLATGRLSFCFGAPIAAPVVTWSGSDELELLEKLFDQVRGHDFNAGVAAGTGHQTAALIGDSAARLANGIRALKKGYGTQAIVNALNGARGRTTGRGKPLPHDDEHRDVELSRRWLEASYGWMPLLSDTHEAAKALALHVQKVRQKQFRARVIRKTSGYQSTTNTTSESSRRYSQQLIYIVKDDRDMPSEFVKLGLTDPFSVAWELVPWSFAIDWFLPIGSMLSAAAMAPHLSGTHVRTVVNRYSGTIVTVNPYWETIQPGLYKSISMSRTVGNTLSVPLPSLKTPFSPSWKRTANQIALLAGLRSRY